MNFGDMMSSMNEELKQNPDKIGGEQKSKYEVDTRFYRISKNKDGGGSVVIRFLPTFNADKSALIPNIKVEQHSPEVFNAQKEKRFISELCPRTIDKDAECPICDYCWDNFNVGKEAGLANDAPQQKKFLKFATKTRFYSNILIVKDEVCPENEGKVFILDYGPAIAKILKREANPTDKEIEFKGKTKFNPWDIFAGRDFVLTLIPGKQTENGFPSWDESFFAANSSAVAGVKDEASAMELISKTHDLNEFLKPEKYSDTETLQKRLDYVLFKQIRRNRWLVQKKMVMIAIYHHKRNKHLLLICIRKMLLLLKRMIFLGKKLQQSNLHLKNKTNQFLLTTSLNNSMFSCYIWDSSESHFKINY